MKNLTKQEMKEIKAMSNTLKPMFNIGKHQITEAVMENISNYLKAHSIVKIKVLAAVDKAQVSKLAEEVVGKLEDTFIVDKKGFTFTLFMHWK